MITFFPSPALGPFLVDFIRTLLVVRAVMYEFLSYCGKNTTVIKVRCVIETYFQVVS